MVLDLNQKKLTDPDIIDEEQNMVLPKPNPLFSENYKILKSGEVLILKRIKTTQDKNEFLKKFRATEDKKDLLKKIKVNENEPSKKKEISIINEEKPNLPRQKENFYVNFGALISAVSSSQTLKDTASSTGTNSFETLNTGLSLEAAFKMKHTLYIDSQVFILPSADSSSFSNDRFNLFNFSYLYSFELTKRFEFTLGLNYDEKVFITDITESLINLEKVARTLPSIGINYFGEQKLFGSIPKLSLRFHYNPQITLGDSKTIEPYIGYELYGALFSTLTKNSHIEYSASLSYENYELDNLESTDIGGALLIKYGREFSI